MCEQKKKKKKKTEKHMNAKRVRTVSVFYILSLFYNNMHRSCMNETDQTQVAEIMYKIYLLLIGLLSYRIRLLFFLI